MCALFKKNVAASLAVAAISGLLTASSPASAHQWHGGFQHGLWGPGLALGVVGLAAGAIAPSEYDCTRYQPVYDRFGNYVGQQPVNVCQ